MHRLVGNGKVALAAFAGEEGIPARDDDGHRQASAQHKDLGPEEGGEQFSPYNTSPCDQIAGSCCTSAAPGRSKPSARHHGNGGIIREAKQEAEAVSLES